jgi:hypothetical protein
MTTYVLSISLCVHLVENIPASQHARNLWKEGLGQGMGTENAAVDEGWALTDWSVTSGTGLTTMPECRCRTSCKLTEN